MIMEIVAWFLAIELLGFLVLPATMKCLKSLPDSGYAASKILGIAAFSYAVWIASYAAGYNQYSILAGLAVLIFVFLLTRKELALLSGKKDIIIKTEVFFIIIFAVFVLLRASMPADINGLEKFSDMSRITGILHSSSMPPSDPWLSGGTINYYYFGHFIVATLTRLTGVSVYESFNISLAAFYSLFALGIFSSLYAILKNGKYAVLGVFMIVFMANALGFLQLVTFAYPDAVPVFSDVLNLEYPLACCTYGSTFAEKTLHMPVWSSTRIVPGTINEFPYANFLFNEVHPHGMSLPLQSLIILIALGIILSPDAVRISRKDSGIVLIAAFCLGLLYFTNSWDYPSYLFLILLSLLAKAKITDALKAFFAISASSLIIVLPYILSTSQNVGKGIVAESTGLPHLLILFPVFIFAILASSWDYRPSARMICAIAALSAIFIYFGKTVLLGAALLLLLSFRKMRQKAAAENMPYLFVFAGSAVLAFTEIFFIDSRYNTVFKLYYHVWIFWGMASAILIAKAAEARAQPRKKIILAIVGFLILASSVLTVFGTVNQISQSNEISLDGIEYLRKYHSFDYEMIEYFSRMNETRAILEAPGDPYAYASPVSTFTGMPSVIGWANHEMIWRGAFPQERVSDADAIYSYTDNDEAMKLLRKYGVGYVVVSDGEIKKYPAESLEKFNNASAYETALSSGSRKLVKVKR